MPIRKLSIAIITVCLSLSFVASAEAESRPFEEYYVGPVSDQTSINWKYIPISKADKKKFREQAKSELASARKEWRKAKRTYKKDMKKCDGKYGQGWRKKCRKLTKDMLSFDKKVFKEAKRNKREFIQEMVNTPYRWSYLPFYLRNTPYEGYARKAPKCSTFSYSIDDRLALSQKARAKNDVRTAFAEMEAASGIQFNEIPWREAHSATPTPRGHILVTWADLRETGVKGRAFPHIDDYSYNGVPWPDWQGYYPIISGVIQLNSYNDGSQNSFVKRGFYLREELVLHELGHTIGMAHNEDPRSVMKNLSAGLTSYDKQAFAVLGGGSSCRS